MEFGGAPMHHIF